MDIISRKLPAYWEEHLQKKIRKLRNWKELAGSDGFCVAMITDFHWRENEKYSIIMLKRILQECDIPYFFQAGDVVSGAGICTKEAIWEELDEYKKAVGLLKEKCLCVEGNHDRAYSTFEPPAYYVENIPKTEFDDVYFSQIRQDGNKIYAQGGYYYVDDEKKKVRYIVLNSQNVPNDETDERGYAKYNSMTNYGFLQKQIEWFAHIALDVPCKAWTVVVCSHVSPNGAKYVRAYNYSLMINILRAFQKGDVYEGQEKHENPLFSGHIRVDFTNKSGNVAAWLGGHIHRDELQMENGIFCVDTTTDAAFVSRYPEKKGTIKEQAFDVFVFDTKQRKCNVVRFGAGEDRGFSY